MTSGHGYWCLSLTEVCFDESLHPDCLSCSSLSLLCGFLINNMCTLHFFTISTHGVRFAAEVPRDRAPTGGPSRRPVPVAGACPPAICQSGWGPGTKTDADAAEEPRPGGRDGAGTTGWSSGRADQLHWPSHHAHREAHLPHEETAVALTVQQT